MHEFRTVTAKVVSVIKDNVKKGHNKWGECAEVEESGEDGQDQEKNLLALAWTTGSRQSWKQICFFLLRFCNISQLIFPTDDACDKAWNGDPKSFPDIDSPSGL